MKTNLKLVGAMIICLVIGSGSVAGRAGTVSPLSLSLSDALSLARKRHVDLIVKDERIRQALARNGQAFSFLLPQLSAEAYGQRRTTDLAASGINIPGMNETVIGPFNTFDARFKLTQMIFDLAAIERLWSVREGEKLSRAEYRKAEQDALALVAGFYVEAERSRESLEAQKALLERDRKELEIMHARFRSGSANAVDARQAKAAYKQDMSRFFYIGHQKKEKELDLLVALGLPLSQDILLNHEETLADFDILNEAQIADEALKHPDVRVAEETVRQRRFERDSRWAEYLPKLSVFGDYGWTGDEPRDLNGTYTMGVRTDVSVFDGGLKAFGWQESDSRLKESKLLLEDAQKRVEARIINSFHLLRQSDMALSAADSQMHAARKTLQVTNQRFSAGVASKLEFLQAKSQYELARDARNEAVAAYLMAEVNLAHALGRMEKLINGPEKKT